MNVFRREEISIIQTIITNYNISNIQPLINTILWYIQKLIEQNFNLRFYHRGYLTSKNEKLKKRDRNSSWESKFDWKSWISDFLKNLCRWKTFVICTTCKVIYFQLYSTSSRIFYRGVFSISSSRISYQFVVLYRA